MLTEKALLVIGLTILGVVVLNAVIFMAWRDGSLSQLIDMTRRVSLRARDPWEEEDSSLKELNQLVKQLHPPDLVGSDPGDQKDKSAAAKPDSKVDGR